MLNALICVVTVPMTRTAPGALSVVAFSHVEKYYFFEVANCIDAERRNEMYKRQRTVASAKRKLLMVE